MMDDETLNGTLVMVNPVLWDDPANRMGQIGVIYEADTAHDYFIVRFDDKEKSAYSADALLVLKSPDQLFEYIENHSATLSPEILKDLNSMALLQEHGRLKHLKTAFELAQSDDNLTLYGMISLEESLGLNQIYKRGR
ncbi:hypothetical protein [Mucilaginibacter sp.]|jgi:hypothetical protein|uniref:hypothetical protein n=1 Tax=Mucilaginibacter sp. TaxID=1882438 RepID=UPI0035653BD8